MSEFYKISTILEDKFKFHTHNIKLIMVGVEPCDYNSDWLIHSAVWESINPDFKNAIDNGTQENIPDRANSALNYLITQAKDFDFSESSDDFIVFETLFYYLIKNAFMFQRFSAQSKELIDINSIRNIITEKQYEYLSLIYDILLQEFCYWIEYRNYVADVAENNSHNNRAAQCGIFLTQTETKIGTKEYWVRIKELAVKAHTLIPKGELANRMMLISDVQLIYVWGDRADMYNLANKKLVEYLKIRTNNDGNPTFILDCFSENFEDSGELEWITGLPYIKGEFSQDIATSKFRNEEEKKEFLETIFSNYMVYPASIYFPQMDGKFLTAAACLEQKNKELENKNAALHKAQDEKKQIIAEFAHTYGNMQATTLQDIGTALLSVNDDWCHENGRKIMVEYAIKQNLTKEVEMLKLQFEDKSSALIQKLHDSITDYGKSIQDLISDSLQRCFMTLLYGETRNDKSIRKLFFGTEDYENIRESRQQSFEQNVLVGNESSLSWIKDERILNLSIDMSEKWKELCFDEGGYAALLITNWITELLINAMKYADKSESINLAFYQSNDLLIITIQNLKEATATNIHGTQQGISSITASIRRLNLAVDCDENVCEISENNNNYQLKLFISSKVLIV